MPHLYLDKRKNPPIWRFQIWTSAGLRKSFTGTTSKRETQEMAIRRQAYEKELAEGIRQKPVEQPFTRPYNGVVDEYLDWGSAQGGRGGRPWGVVTKRNKTRYMTWWRKELSVSVMQELGGSLARVEKALRTLMAQKRSGKTLAHYAAALKTFISWAIDRDYLDKSPLRKLTKFDHAPKTLRRAMTSEEIKRLLAVCAEHRRLLYEVAFCTGLRAGELKSLRIEDLDEVRGGLVLSADWTKNRKSGFQPLPTILVGKLKAAAELKLAELTYTRYTRTSDNKPPKNPLLYISSHAARDLDIDLESAGIPKVTAEGKLDFHACRVAYITHLIDAGSDVKTVQTLARHSDPRITLMVYAKARPEKLAEAAQNVGNALLTV